MNHEPTGYHSPIDLADARAAKVAKARPAGMRQAAPIDPPAGREERFMRWLVVVGGVMTVASVLAYALT